MKKDMAAPVRIAAYMRVSTDEQRDAGTIENQRLEIARFAEYKKYEILDYFEDDGVSGVKPVYERTRGRDLWEAVAAGEYDAVVVYRIDRIARRIKHVLDFTDLAEQNKCRIITCNENIDFSSQWGKLILSILAAFAEAEHAAITDRAIAGKRRKLASGKILGRPPYGYTNNQGTLEIDEARSPFVKQIFERYVRGESYRVISTYLNSAKAPLPPGRSKNPQWMHHHISYILHHSAYCGEYRGFSSRPKKDHKYIGEKRDQDDVIAVKVPAIISKALFDQAQRKITENRFLGPQSKTRFYLLRGMIRCGKCGMLYSGIGQKGGTYTRKTGSRAGKTEEYARRFYYECSSKYKAYSTNRPFCGNINLKAFEIEALVWAECEKVLLKPSIYTKKIIELQKENSNSINSLYKQLAKIESSIHKTETRRNKIVRAIASGTITRDEAASVMDEVRRETETLNEHKVKIDVRINETDDTKQQRLDTIQTVLNEFAAKLKSGITEDDKRQIIQLLISEIIVSTEFPDGQPEGSDPRGYKVNKRPLVKMKLFYDEENFIDAVSGLSRPLSKTWRDIRF
jgi:site-specific DNA recombinase